MSSTVSNATHHPKQQHHFESMEQQFDASKMGMWLFLVTEVLLFSGMFVAYAVYRQWHPEAFVALSTALDWKLGGLNTLVLLLSSFTVAMSINAIQRDKKQQTVIYLIITLLCAAAFMVVKAIEYSGKFGHGVFPGGNFAPFGDHYGQYADIPYAAQFFSIYFVMTGIHGIHVLIGMGIITWIAIRTQKGHFDSSYYTPIELTGLYWHLVDIIWIFLFPLLYLI